MKEKQKYWIIGAIVIMTLVIWGNSMVPRDQSAQMSGGFTAWLVDTFHWSLTEHMVRKAAHFCEYAVLGVLYGLFFWRQGRGTSYTYPLRASWTQRLFNCAAAGLITAVIDESIQIFSGRGPLVSDILIDFCGFGTGFIVLQLIVHVFRRR